MRNRSSFVLGAIAALLLAAGAAWATIPTDISATSVVEVADAGTVTIDRGRADLAISDVRAAAGWTYVVEVATGREVEVDFRRNDRRVRLIAELEDGEVRARVRDRLAAAPIEDATSTTMDDSPSTSVPASTPASIEDSTSTTVDDVSSTTVDDSTPTTVDDSTPTTVDDSTPTTVDDSTSTTKDDDASTSTTVDDDPSATGEDRGDDVPGSSGSYSVGGVATVTIAWSDGRLSLVSVSVIDGWGVVDQDLRSDRVELEFENDERAAEFKADLEHGSVRVETKVD